MKDQRPARVEDRGNKPRRARCLVWALVFLIAGVTATAPPAAASAAESVFPPAVRQRLDAKFRTILRTHRLPSVAVGVWQPGKAPYIFVAGTANLRTHAARQLDQPFRIASITKAFVAVAVLQLVDAGLLRKSDTMSRWYPHFPNAKSITIDDLLRMRSGIAAPSDDIVLASVYDHPLADHPTTAEQIAAAAALRARFIAPGTTGVYTDLNYVILGDIVKRVSGHDIGYYIKRGIIDKLHLRQTAYPTDNTLPGGLRGYGWNKATRRFDDKTLFNPLLAGPAGAMISSLQDLNVYARAVCVGGLVTPALQRSLLDGQAIRGTNVRYGEGVISNGPVCGHSGTINGFSTDMYHLTIGDTTVVINVSRLDKDNASQTTSYLRAVFEAVTMPVRPAH